jgi:polysaccharide export outer membrane protein
MIPGPFKISGLFLAAALMAGAQQSTDKPVFNGEAGGGAALPMQKIGPEDLVSIQVYDAPEFTRSVRVSADGTIRLPMMKTPIRIQGLFPNEVETALTEALQREKLIVDPFVTVNITEYHSRPISLNGAVRIPVIFQAIGSVSLLDAIARAGGVSDLAGPDIVITRPNGGPDAVAVQRIPIKPLIEGIDPSLNIKLSGGEEIRVPEVGKMVVEGSVLKPGIYPVQDPAARNTVMTAIAQAGGLAQFAEHKAYIIRTDDQGQTHMIDVPLWEIINRRKPDMILQARDTLQIPDSPKRRITQTTIQSVTGVGTSVGSGIILLHH